VCGQPLFGEKDTHHGFFRTEHVFAILVFRRERLRAMTPHPDAGRYSTNEMVPGQIPWQDRKLIKKIN